MGRPCRRAAIASLRTSTDSDTSALAAAMRSSRRSSVVRLTRMVVFLLTMTLDIYGKCHYVKHMPSVMQSMQATRNYTIFLHIDKDVGTT